MQVCKDDNGKGIDPEDAEQDQCFEDGGFSCQDQASEKDRKLSAGDA